MAQDRFSTSSFMTDPMAPRMAGGMSMDDATLRTLLIQYLARSSEAHHDPWVTRTRNALVHYGGGPDVLHLHGHNEPDRTIDSYRFLALEACRSDVASLTRFSQRVDFATYHLCAAIGSQDTIAFWRPKRSVRQHHLPKSLYAFLVRGTFERYHVLRAALAHPWTPLPDREPLREIAFLSLCELTPADSQLRALFDSDKPRAFSELTRHLDLVAEQLEVTVALAEDLAPAADRNPVADEDARRTAVQTDLLARSGEALSLTSAANRLGMTRQALHKRIKLGSALGVMRGNELVIPSAQFVVGGAKEAIVPHLRDVLALFLEAEAGNWSALQFLIEPDPNLDTCPLDAIKAGETQAAVTAARAYLGLDEA